MPQARNTAYLALGSNLGNREANLRGAFRALAGHPCIAIDAEHGVASLYETSPVGGPPDQPAFLNLRVRDLRSD